MKITTSFENINSFGGLNFISNEFDRLKLYSAITSHLGSIFTRYHFTVAKGTLPRQRNPPEQSRNSQ